MNDPIKSSSECIDWATIDKNTTKTDMTGGLGLTMMINFVTANQGKMQILSGNGFWENSTKLPVRKEIMSIFPGTLINFEFDLSRIDKEYYDFKN